MKHDFKYGLGSRLRDQVTLFEGIVVTRAEHLSGCDTYGLQPTELKDGAPQDIKWFDEPRLQIYGKGIGAVDTRATKTGADSIPQSTRSI